MISCYVLQPTQNWVISRSFFFYTGWQRNVPRIITHLYSRCVPQQAFCLATFPCPFPSPSPLVQLSIAIANSRLTDKDIISLRPKNRMKILRPRKLSMACATEYTDEQLNYYRICYLTTDILAKGLRSIFKQEWDNRYKATKGE